MCLAIYLHQFKANLYVWFASQRDQTTANKFILIYIVENVGFLIFY